MTSLVPTFREEHVDVIVNFIAQHLEDSGRHGLVVGMSGGLDSSLVAKLCTEAVGPDRVLGIWLGECPARGGDYRDARDWAKKLRIPFREVDISPLIHSFVEHLNVAKKNRIAIGNIKARIRMIVLYDVARRENRLVIGTGNKSELLTGYFCYDSETRLMTPDGPKHYWELQPGSVVFSMDVNTQKVVEVPVESIHVFDYEGDMIEIRTGRLDMLVTPNHRLLVRRSHGKDSVGFVTAESRMAGGSTALPTPEPWDGAAPAPSVIDTGTFLQSENVAWNANPPVRMATEDFLYLMGLHIGGGTVSVGRISVQVKSDLTPQERMTFSDEYGRFDLVSDGPLRVRSHNAPRIFIASAKGKRSRTPLMKILEHYGIHATQTPTLVAFTNQAMTAAFADCGSGAKYKQIPTWALKLPAQHLLHLYRGLMDSGGNADGHAFTTTSERLAYQMIELCAKLGLHAWVSFRPPKMTLYQGREIRSSGTFEIRISPYARNLTFHPRNMQRVYYKGKIWCPSVPPHENVLVERHNRMVFCGNTKFGDGGADFLPIGDLYKTQVRAMAKYLGVPNRILKKTPSAGLWTGQTDEGELGLSYELLDRILLGVELGLADEDIVERCGARKRQVERVRELVRNSIHKRKTPLAPKVGYRTIGLDWRE